LEELLREFDQVARLERRHRLLDPALIVVLTGSAFAIAWAQGAAILPSLTAFWLGSAVGSHLVGAIHRRRAYQRMRASIEIVRMCVAYEKDVE
jgi:hypothetical protein